MRSERCHIRMEWPYQRRPQNNLWNWARGKHLHLHRNCQDLHGLYHLSRRACSASRRSSRSRVNYGRSIQRVCQKFLRARWFHGNQWVDQVLWDWVRLRWNLPQVAFLLVETHLGGHPPSVLLSRHLRWIQDVPPWHRWSCAGLRHLPLLHFHLPVLPLEKVRWLSAPITKLGRRRALLIQDCPPEPKQNHRRHIHTRLFPNKFCHSPIYYNNLFLSSIPPYIHIFNLINPIH